MKSLQSKLNYKFKDPSLLELAVTHSSYANEKGGHNNNERLEFLGDSVLGFITAEYLFTTMPGTPEGWRNSPGRSISAAICCWARGSCTPAAPSAPASFRTPSKA